MISRLCPGCLLATAEVEPDELAETCDPASQRAVLQPLVIIINSQECSTADLVLRLNKTTAPQLINSEEVLWLP